MNRIINQPPAKEDNMLGLKELKREVENEKSYILKIRDDVKKVLQEDYKEIYNFFLQLLNIGYSYVILMSRRCQVLYQIFLRFFILEDDVKELKSTIISNQILPYYIKNLENKEVAIVDDILIHGRAIQKLYNTIYGECPNAEIKIHVYTADQEIESINENIRHKVHAEYITCKEDWRNLSNKIVCSIFAANEPYTSFVSAYFSYNNRKDYSALMRNKKISMIDMTSPMQKQYGLISHYFYEGEIQRPPLFRSFSAGEGIRVYWKKNVSKLTIIPYVFTKSMLIEDSENLCKKVAECLPKSMEYTRTILSKETKNNLAEYKARLLTCLFSNVYWLIFKTKYNISDRYYIDINTLNESFGALVSREFNELTMANISNILQITAENKEQDFCKNEEKELSKVLNCAFQNGTSIRDVIKNYFQDAWYIDECRAKENKERYDGLLIESFIQRAYKNDINKHEVYASLINAWDNGLATGNYIYDKSKGQIGSYVMPGERAFIILIEKYPYLIKMLIFVSKNIFKKGEMETENSYRERKKDILKRLAKEYCQIYNIGDYTAIENIIDFERGYLNPLNQTMTINAMLPSDKNKDDNFIINFMKKNL